MSAGDASPFRHCCVTMLSPGAAWQCSILRQIPGMKMSVCLMDRYEDTVEQAEHTSFFHTAPMTDQSSRLSVDSSSFRLRMTQDKGKTYLSGFIETASKDSLLWDTELTPLHEEPCWQLCRAQGRFVSAEREILFPSASSFLVIEYDPDCTRGLGCAQDPFSAVYLSGKDNGLSLTKKTRRSLPTAVFQSEEGGVSCIWPENAEHFRFQPSSQQRFHIRLSRHRTMVTTFGLWSDESLIEKRTLPGFITSVI